MTTPSWAESPIHDKLRAAGVDPVSGEIEQRPSDAMPCWAIDCSRIDDSGCDSCVAYQMANEQLRADVKRLIVERNRIAELVAKWRDMPAEEMRLRAGDMTSQEIRSIKAVLNAILPNATRMPYHPQKDDENTN